MCYCRYVSIRQRHSSNCSLPLEVHNPAAHSPAPTRIDGAATTAFRSGRPCIAQYLMLWKVFDWGSVRGAPEDSVSFLQLWFRHVAASCCNSLDKSLKIKNQNCLLNCFKKYVCYNSIRSLAITLGPRTRGENAQWPFRSQRAVSGLAAWTLEYGSVHTTDAERHAERGCCYGTQTTCIVLSLSFF